MVTIYHDEWSVPRGWEARQKKPAAPNLNMQERLSLSIVHLISSVNYTAEMKRLFIRGPCRKKKKRAVKLRRKTPSQLHVCAGFFWIPSRFSIGEIPDDLHWGERVLGADVTNRTLQQWSASWAAAEDSG